MNYFISLLIALSGLQIFHPSLARATLNCSASSNAFFQDENPLDWEIQGDFAKVNDGNLYLSEKAQATSRGTLTQNGETIPVVISARGAFRFEECYFRPFRLEALEENTKGTFPFLKGFSKLKLVTICSDRNPQDRVLETRKLMKEYTIYKMLKHLSYPSMDVRLIQFHLKNPNGSFYLVAPGFLRESEKALAQRCGMKVREPTIKRSNIETREMERWLRFKDNTLKLYRYVYDPESLYRLELVSLFLNNSDYILEFDHNTLPLVSNDPNELIEYVIPYDFDLSQAAGGTYYQYVITPQQKAKQLMDWFRASKYPALAAQLRAEFVKALPKMKAEVEKSPLLDGIGKRDLTLWIEAFENASQLDTL